MSVPNPKPGDWLEHEALGRRGHWNKLGKLAEITDVARTSVTLYLEGEASKQTVTRAELTRWWSTFKPAEIPDDVVPPNWVQPGREFHVSLATGEHVAVVRAIKGPWLSFTETGPEYQDVLRIKPYREFATHGWRALHRPSVWEWLRRPLV